LNKFGSPVDKHTFYEYWEWKDVISAVRYCSYVGSDGKIKSGLPEEIQRDIWNDNEPDENDPREKGGIVWVSETRRQI